MHSGTDVSSRPPPLLLPTYTMRGNGQNTGQSCRPCRVRLERTSESELEFPEQGLTGRRGDLERRRESGMEDELMNGRL